MTGFVNTLKIPNKTDFIEEMKQINMYLVENMEEMNEQSYIFDPICPKLIFLCEASLHRFSKSKIVQDFCFIFLVCTAYIAF